jgi:hypothetical protein
LLWIANACLATGHWPTEFKASITVIIPKPGKLGYDTPKAFCPIVLLDTMEKPLEKMLVHHTQFEVVEHSIFHPHQFGSVCQNSTEDAGCFLTHLVCAGWANNLKTSMVAFDLAQSFPSINHNVLLHIFRQQGFSMQVVDFMQSYLKDRKTQDVGINTEVPIWDLIGQQNERGSSESHPNIPRTQKDH